MNRRVFLRHAALVGGTAVLAACGGRGNQAQQAPAPARPSAFPTVRPTSTLPAAGSTRVPLPTSAPTSTVAAPTATPSRTPQATADDWRGTVVLVKTANRAEGVRRAVELLGVNPIPGKKVLLKPNFNSARFDAPRYSPRNDHPTPRDGSGRHYLG
jgi:hypothetical protein